MPPPNAVPAALWLTIGRQAGEQRSWLMAPRTPDRLFGGSQIMSVHSGRTSITRRERRLSTPRPAPNPIHPTRVTPRPDCGREGQTWTPRESGDCRPLPRMRPALARSHVPDVGCHDRTIRAGGERRLIPPSRVRQRAGYDKRTPSTTHDRIESRFKRQRSGRSSNRPL